MKKFLLTVLAFSTITLGINAQTKGTNALGFGVTSQRYENSWNENGSMQTQKQNAFSITYGRFIEDNSRLGLTGSLSRGKYEGSSFSSKTDGFGGGLHYQKYYPLFKKLYAFGGGRVATFHEKIRNFNGESTSSGSSRNYSIGANGGAAFFLSKRFAFEAQLLSADFSYTKTKNAGSSMNSENSFLNITTKGFINDLGFNIYFLF